MVQAEPIMVEVEEGLDLDELLVVSFHLIHLAEHLTIALSMLVALNILSHLSLEGSSLLYI